MPRHNDNDTQRADALPAASVRPSSPTTHELLETMEEIVSHLAAFCREVEAVLSHTRPTPVGKEAS
jgi:hypothetical protein